MPSWTALGGTLTLMITAWPAAGLLIVGLVRAVRLLLPESGFLDAFSEAAFLEGITTLVDVLGIGLLAFAFHRETQARQAEDASHLAQLIAIGLGLGLSAIIGLCGWAILVFRPDLVDALTMGVH